MNSAHVGVFHSCLTLLTVVFLSCDVFCTSFSSYLYGSDTVCGVQERISRGCLSLASDSRFSVLQCAVLCQNSVSFCDGMVMNSLGQCYFFQDCASEDNAFICSDADVTYVRYKLTKLSLPLGSCANNAVFNAATGKCVCRDYWLGKLCERRPRTCQELRDNQFPLGYHFADMNLLGQTLTTRVKCRLGADFVRTYVSTSNGLSDFNKTFAEYRHGFYHGDQGFWLGLDNAHALSQAGLDTLVLSATIDTEEVATTFKGSTVGDASSDYEIYYSSLILNRNAFHITAEECIPNKVKFSTWDRDNDDELGRNLPAETGSGWWYLDDDVTQYFCNPHGKAPTSTSPEGQIDYVSMRGLNLTYIGMGQSFQSVGLYFLQMFP